MQVKVLRSHPYAGVMRRKGSVYEIFDAKDLKVLTTIKAVEVIKLPSPVYSHQDMTAQDDDAESKPAKKKKRVYKRRDMRAKSARKKKEE